MDNTLKPDQPEMSLKPEPDIQTKWGVQVWIFPVFLLIGALTAYLDAEWQMHTILVETVHALVVSVLFILCLVCQQRYPEVRQYGWSFVVWGVGLLMMGSWIDILDDPPTLHWLTFGDFQFGRSWQQAFMKKILGYTMGVALIAVGFVQWIPWMLSTQRVMNGLNRRLRDSSKALNQALLSRDESVESERLRISRELHDEVAQQLTSLKLQVKLAEKLRSQKPAQFSEWTADGFAKLGHSVSEVIQNVRSISRNLRPESLYSLGFSPAVAQFLDQRGREHPEIRFILEDKLFARSNTASQLPEMNAGSHIEQRFSERARLHVFRMIQEAVRNAVKHSQAKQIQVILEPDRVIIQDDGRGFPWVHSKQPKPSDDDLIQEGHFGLVGLFERAIEAGVSCELQTGNSTLEGNENGSEGYSGARIVFTWPEKPEE
ncbi:MAG: hypothetical protein K2X01_04120 [Cyanobacteria bacterium]|nr:hypothetical protein [Cyanobacteriota bacterium]